MVRRSDGRWQQSVTDIDAFGRRKTKYFYGKTKSELLQKIAAYNAEATGRKRGVTFQTLATAGGKRPNRRSPRTPRRATRLPCGAPPGTSAPRMRRSSGRWT